MRSREEEIQELFIKNRINRKLKRKIKFFNMFLYLTLVIILILIGLATGYDNIVFAYIGIGLFFAYAILIPFLSLTLLRCPYCGKWIAPSLRVGYKCANCGENTEYHKSLEDMEMKRNQEKEW